MGAFVVIKAGATTYHCMGLVDTVLPGSKSGANAQWGSLGTWEIPKLSTLEWPGGTNRLNKSQARGWSTLASAGAKHQSAGIVVPPSEGNGACGKEAGSLSPFIVPVESRETYPGEACE